MSQQPRVTNLLILAGISAGTLGIIAEAAYFIKRVLVDHLLEVDFVADYTAARIVASPGLSSLYRLPVQAHVQASIVNGYWPGHYHLLAFVNPPYLALFLRPLANLSFSGAYLAWSILNLAGGVAGFWLLISTFGIRPQAKLAWTLLAIVWLPFLTMVLQGQADGLLLLGLGLFYRLTIRGKPMVAGAALGLALVKPHLILLLPVMLAVRRQWHALAGLVAVALGLVVAVAAIDPQVWVGYIQLTLPDAAQVHEGWATGTQTSLVMLGLLQQLGAPPALRWGFWLAAGAGILLTMRSNRRPFEFDFSLAILGSLVLAPHVNYHDLVLAAIPWLLMIPPIVRGEATWLMVALLGGVYFVLQFGILLPLGVVAATLVLWTVVLSAAPQTVISAPLRSNPAPQIPAS
ncbi:MAG TPA: glycosyltransferase family 87 protein [Candidatus Dormibacteraeota bacterium]|nr:glycosyltransferase family 87 protein [Candidatus Dormibacteraeota bacterium]